MESNLFLDVNLAQRMHLRKREHHSRKNPMQPGEEQTWGKHPGEPRRNGLNLERLRDDALAALDARGIDGLLQIRLNGLQVQYPEIPTRTVTLTGPDIYPNPAHPDIQPVIPATGKLTRASFIAQLADSPAPCRVELALPNTVSVSCPSATQAIGHWAARSGFFSSPAQHQ
jgi:hypothetical protein